jgi:hypothetical protein
LSPADRSRSRRPKDLGGERSPGSFSRCAQARAISVTPRFSFEAAASLVSPGSAYLLCPLDCPLLQRWRLRRFLLLSCLPQQTGKGRGGTRRKNDCLGTWAADRPSRTPAPRVESPAGRAPPTGSFCSLRPCIKAGFIHAVCMS